MMCILSPSGGLITTAVSQPSSIPAMMLQAGKFILSMPDSFSTERLQYGTCDNAAHLTAALTGRGHQIDRLFRSTDAASLVNVRLGTNMKKTSWPRCCLARLCSMFCRTKQVSTSNRQLTVDNSVRAVAASRSHKLTFLASKAPMQHIKTI